MLVTGTEALTRTLNDPALEPFVTRIACTPSARRPSWATTPSPIWQVHGASMFDAIAREKAYAEHLTDDVDLGAGRVELDEDPGEDDIPFRRRRATEPRSRVGTHAVPRSRPGATPGKRPRDGHTDRCHSAPTTEERRWDGLG